MSADSRCFHRAASIVPPPRYAEFVDPPGEVPEAVGVFQFRVDHVPQLRFDDHRRRDAVGVVAAPPAFHGPLEFAGRRLPPPPAAGAADQSVEGP